MSQQQVSGNKKRLMFIKGEDFYFLTYNIIIILKTLGCNSAEKTFKDYRKLAFLVDFSADWTLLNILRSYPSGRYLNYRDKEMLMRSYSSGLVRINEILKLLFALEKKGLIGISKNAASSQLDIYLREDSVPSNLFENNIFKLELDNANMLKRVVPRLSMIKLETLLSSIYYDYGITKWVTH
ncbi:hypothetical protein [Mucilaginibacter sp.]|uniref:hypothetical protein n=1 Tax=Mucilaginibacter sp. TaxID=1882438 RepID=UPI0025F16E83|nr:hypothetical protein [Mucilaginibacter sp.]